MEHIKDYNADVVFLSETWMRSNKDDITAMIKPYGYTLVHNRRRNRDKVLGGGVGVMFKTGMSYKQISCKPFSSFEHIIVKVQLVKNTNFTLISIYRLHFVPTNVFLDEFTQLLEMLSASSEIFVLSGDINIHLDEDDSYAVRMKDIFSMFNLKQYVDFPTHKLGHTIDCVLAASDCPQISELLGNNVELSDHFLLSFKVKIYVRRSEYKSITYRDLKSLDNEQFCADVNTEYENIQSGDFQRRVNEYNERMTKVVDVHCPQKTKQIKVVTYAPWFDLEYSELRKLRRKAEKKYKKSGLQIHKQEFVELRKKTTNLAFNKKREYYKNKIDECGGNSKTLFACLNKLLDIKQETVLPYHSSSEELANRFKTYFNEKIRNIRKAFPSQPLSSDVISNFDQTHVLSTFEPATVEEIKLVISTRGINCSPDDPVPIALLKNNLDTFVPIWLELVNLSLRQGSMECLKNAVVRPLIKELDDVIDRDVLKNYRPVSNLVFLSKLIERIVANRLDNHMTKHGLHCSKQYGYKTNHSTEMLLVKIVNDLFISCDQKIPTIVMFLDLSAAFDTVDQCKLLKILQHDIGISGVALMWFKSFLVGRSQIVKIGESYSSEDPLKYGVPQGSVLGPPLFNIYTRSFPEKVNSIGYEIEGFADDHQIRKHFSPIFQVKALGMNIDRCFQVITAWMNEFFLGLNSSKTKILVVAPPSVQNNILVKGTFIDGRCIRFVDSAKNLGIIIDNELLFEDQIKKLVSTCLNTIRSISRIKAFLNEDQLKTLVSALVFSKIDYCNALYYGLNSRLLNKLQVVQNSAVRLIYKMNRYDRLHVSGLFLKLHWLKIKERITFKILLIVHKCLNGVAPPDVIDLITPSKSVRARKLEIRKSLSAYGDRSFAVAGPKLWNALPLYIRVEVVTTEFKKRLKSFLLTSSDSFYQVVNRQ